MTHYAAYKIRTLICNPCFWCGIEVDKLFYELFYVFAMSDDVACFSGTATEYLISKSSIVSIYECIRFGCRE